MKEAHAAQQVAERLYYDSAELTFQAQVRDIQLVARERGADGANAQLWRVALDRTAFYPESGGQPWDTGVLVATARSGATLEVPVERVEEDEAGEVWHFVRKPLVEGTEVEGRVDPDRRLDHMQQHSGQHLLSAVFLMRLAAKTISFHLGAESSTIDLALPEGARDLRREQLASIEDAANRLIFENRAMRCRWHTRAEAEAMLARGELRKLPDRSGPLRVIEMDGVEFNACGGTHVPSIGAIGGLQLRRLDKVKGGWRVEFLCGLRAVRAARKDFGLLSDAAGLLTVSTDDVPSRLRGLQDEVKTSAKARRALMEELAEARASELAGKSAQGEVVQAIFDGRPVEFAKRIASAVAANHHAVVIGVTEGESAALALALPANDTRHAGNLLREISIGFAARGGGGPQLAQGVCEARNLPDLLEAVATRLKTSGQTE